MGQATTSSSIHPILCFAHRGEAKAFLAELPFKPSGDLENTYHYLEDDILFTLTLTGEGTQNATAHLAFLLGHLKALHPEKSFGVLNLGVAGLLRKDQGLDIGKAYLVRTLYANDELGKPLFKSYTSNLFESPSSIDCITSSLRVLNKEHSINLSHFATLVDREAHGIGMVCESFQTPFAIIKVISDEAEGEICSQVKEEAPLWSDLLLKKYLEVFPTAKLPFEAEELEIPGLHITVSQQRLLQNLLKACELKGIDKELALKRAHLSEILEQDIRPKDKTKRLLECLVEVINPLEADFQKELKNIIKPLEENGFKVRFEQGFEDDTIHLSTTLQHQKNINNLIQGLESFNYLRLQGLFRGQKDKDV